MKKNQYMKGYLLIFLISSCVGKTTESSEIEIDSLVELSIMKHHDDDYKQYFIYSYGGRIYLTDGSYLHKLYNDRYRNKIEYNHYLSSLLDSLADVKLEDSFSQYYYDSFIEDKEVSAYYHKKGLKSLQKRYCSKEGDYLVIKPTSVDKKLTIAYYHWINGYVYHFGGLSGFEYLSKIEGTDL